MSGISIEPGTQATSIASSGTPCSFSFATAPSSSLRVIDSFQRATTMAKRRLSFDGAGEMTLGMAGGVRRWVLGFSEWG